MQTKNDIENEDFFNGKNLYGNDFSDDQLVQWYKEEEDAYYDLYIRDRYKPYRKNDSLHYFHGFSHILKENKSFNNVLGFGSGDGKELSPIKHLISNLVVVESSDKYFQTDSDITFSKATIDGKINLESNKFDLVVCFAALHHVANASFVLSEFYRCLKPGGYLLLKEPITTMGDWRSKRDGCTKNERGFPVQWLDQTLVQLKFNIISRRYHEFSLFKRLWTKLNIQIYDNKMTVILDSILSKIFSFNTKYHRKSIFEKIGPTYLFYVLEK